MSKVIKGAFPQTNRIAPAKDNKPIPSYILHISITFSDPLIWRRIQVPGELNLTQLHEVIQKAMGWSDSYVHQFLIGKIAYEPTQRQNIPRESKRFDEAKYKLYTLEEGMTFMFTYLYASGEGWEHEITVEEIVPPTTKLSHSILLSGEMACPPEEVGDVHIYNNLTHAQETPGHKDFNTLSELAEVANFDPSYFDLDAAKDRISSLQHSLKVSK